MLGNDLSKKSIHFACHTCGITADVKICLLFQEFVDFRGGFLELVLDVNLSRSFARKGCVDFEVVAKGLFVFLEI